MTEKVLQRSNIKFQEQLTVLHMTLRIKAKYKITEPKKFELRYP